MTDVVKHTLKYQEARATQLLNAHTKDLFGRHRGHVLYGMKLTPTGPNACRIGAGALYTPLGTHLYWDVTDAVSNSTVNLAAAGSRDLSTVLTASRPVVIAIIATVATSAANRPFSMESPLQTGASTVQFSAREVSFSRAAGGHPTYSLAPYSPIGMDIALSKSLFDYYHTWDLITAATKAPQSVTAELGSVQTPEILLGYLVVGVDPVSGASPTTYCVSIGGGSYDWSPGVVYVPLRNPHEAVAEALGFDPMLGRIADGVVSKATGGAKRSTSQLALTPPGSSGLCTLQAPMFGTTAVNNAPGSTGTDAPWTSDWTTYRWPSFFRDGEQLLWAMRRLDYVLRLWMNRTGDQSLITATQDTYLQGTEAGGSDRAGSRFQQATLAQLLRHFNGNTIVTSTSSVSRNSNDMGWGVAGTAGDSSVANGHVIIDGVAVNDPTVTSGGGDSHFTAIAALDGAVYHLLTDVVGAPSYTKAQLRGGTALNMTTAWTDAAPTTQTITYGDGCVSPYAPGRSGNQTIAAMMNLLAARLNSGAGRNILINGSFIGPVPSAVALGWTIGLAGGSALGDHSVICYSPLTYGKRFGFHYHVNGAGGSSEIINQEQDVLADYLAPFMGYSFTILCWSTANLPLVRLIFKNSGGTSVGYVDVVPNAPTAGVPVTLRGTVDISSFIGSVAKVRVGVLTQAGGNYDFEISGMWVGAGAPPANVVDSTQSDYLSRFGSSCQPMQDYIDMNSHKITNVSNGTSAGDAVNKGQLDGLQTYVDQHFVYSAGTPSVGSYQEGAIWGQP